MATTKKVAKKAAKKAVPKVKVEEPKQIILTQEQYDALVSIKSELSTISWSLASTFSNKSDNVREVAFNIGAIQAKLDVQQSKLDDITTAVDPNPWVYNPDEWEDVSDDDDDNN